MWASLSVLIMAEEKLSNILLFEGLKNDSVRTAATRAPVHAFVALCLSQLHFNMNIQSLWTAKADWVDTWAQLWLDGL